ncbi:MAG: putative DNA modification/repair radical SAM protein [Synergistaceae bacterium]|jgi:putative DNA modification/repair radical SAM protein|nr:putative DNA modification/repair radical SAM protein [Synergistaceae bacterium]
MDVMNKLAILADAAKYDVSCSSSGSRRTNEPGGIGNACSAGICHTWTDDGRCVSLLKLLLTNDCVYDCAYCVNRRSNDRPRATFTPREVADLTINFYRRNYIEGLFLSSGVLRSPDDTMIHLIRTVAILRNEYRFNGYVHAKAIPGASPELIDLLGRLADRMSVNIELPTERSLSLLAPQKTKEGIFKPMRFIHGRIEERAAEKRKEENGERRLALRAPRFAPAGQTTQLIIGATPETDLGILRLSEALYGKFGLKRVYYSAYLPVNEGRNLPALAAAPPLLREHRLYQADWLLRFYGFAAEEIAGESAPSLDEALDPKTAWALRNMHFFPVDVNRADYERILRIPGVGVRSAKRIVVARRARRLRHEDLKRLGVVMKRAEHFLTCDGRAEGKVVLSLERLRRFLAGKPAVQQLRLPFDPI